MHQILGDERIVARPSIKDRKPHARSIENLIEKIVLYSRWLLVIFYLGLAVALAMYGFHFITELGVTALKLYTLNSSEVLLKMLVFIDKALVASLIVMVMLSGYENFISRIDVNESRETLSWLGKLDPGSIKIKVASSIVAISSIHLLQVFLNMSQATEQWHVVWQTIIHMAFVLSALLLGYLSRLTHHEDDHASDHAENSHATHHQNNNLQRPIDVPSIYASEGMLSASWNTDLNPSCARSS